jgi:cell division initiation protein
MRGYDADEVDAFLSMVADELELLIREKNQVNDELIKLRTQLKDYQQVEQTLRDTLMKAQNTVEESRANSRREAEIIIHEAELQAEHIVKEAKESLKDLKNEIYMLQVQKESFAKRLKHLLESQIELLQVLDFDDVNMEFQESQSPDSEHQDTEDYRSEPRIVRDDSRSQESSSRPSDDQDSLSDQVIM